MSIPAHAFADLFPMLGPADAAALEADIAANGLRERIVILGGDILDGRNRYRAAVAAGVIPAGLPAEGDGLWVSHFRRFVPAQDGDPLAWVLSKNLHRRHLSEGQRAMVAADIARMGQGRPKDSENKPANLPVIPSQPEAAEMLHVSERSVRSAVKVREHGAPELVDRVRSGEVAVSAAADIASLPITQQLAIMRGADPRAFRSLAAEKRRELTEQKKVRREERVEELAVKITALPTRKYGVIYADPEWEHEVWSDSGMHKAAANHYPVSSLDVIKSRPVSEIAADDCVLFMWTTVPHEKQAHAVMEEWGFEYKSQAVWVKAYPGAMQGMGYWFRINHEILLVGTRGRVPAPAPGTQFGSVFTLPVGAHSAKPVEFHEMIEALYGPLPKIELNARVRRPGWDAWGLEAPEKVHEASEAIAMSFEEAAPILRAEYRGENGKELAARLGRPVNTIRKWAFKLGLSDPARNVARGMANLEKVNLERKGEKA